MSGLSWDRLIPRPGEAYGCGPLKETHETGPDFLVRANMTIPGDMTGRDIFDSHFHDVGKFSNERLYY